MNRNQMINSVLHSHIATQKAVSAAYDTVPLEVESMYKTYLRKSEGQPEGVVNLCAQDLGFKLIEFMGDK